MQKKRQLAAGLQVLCRTCTPLLHTKAPSFCGPAVAPQATEVSGWWRRRLTLFHLSSIFYRLCGEATIVFHKAALPVELISSGVVTPSQAFSWEISRLIVAVAIFTYRVIVHAATARNDE